MVLEMRLFLCPWPPYRCRVEAGPEAGIVSATVRRCAMRQRTRLGATWVCIWVCDSPSGGEASLQSEGELPQGSRVPG